MPAHLKIVAINSAKDATPIRRTTGLAQWNSLETEPSFSIMNEGYSEQPIVQTGCSSVTQLLK